MATIKDVAELAGVSTATVSHVLNQTRFVASSTCERVWAAMQTLNYAPSAVARSLKVQATNTIGMLVTSSTNPFFAEVVRGVERYCLSQGYSLILCNTEGDTETARACLQMLIRKRIDGLLLLCTDTHTDLTGLLQQHEDLPLVIMDWGPATPHSDRIQDNSLRGGWLATRHLLELGHTAIACITGPHFKQPAQARLVGYHQAMQEAGCTVDPGWIVEGNFDCQSGWQAMQHLLRLPNRPTAVLACNDLMAMGVLRAAAEAGLRVPADLSVIGYDNIPFAQWLTPSLSSINQPKESLGELAVQTLLERIHDPAQPGRSLLLEPNLVARESTAAPGAAIVLTPTHTTS